MDEQYKQLVFPEIIVFMPKTFSDIRGMFYENFNYISFTKNTGISFDVIQENISCSKKNVLRGLHFQKGKHAQSKLVNVIKGSILDVIVDIRENSKNFGKWLSYRLDDVSKESIYIPEGFAHGFLSMSKSTKISYKVNKPYNKSSECSIAWNDKDILINWPCKKPILSSKDKLALSFKKNYETNNFSITQ